MIPMKMRRLTHPVVCSVNKCKSRDTYMIHRGTDRGNPIHICVSCMAEMAREYIRLVGVEKAREDFSDVIKVLIPDEKGMSENKGGDGEGGAHTSQFGAEAVKKSGVKKNGKKTEDQKTDGEDAAL